ncbi:MAG: DUF87 domain-containing protein [Sulfolobus sp.]|nr:DUF87 domain-containing protein [Sulfolobus sp.]
MKNIDIIVRKEYINKEKYLNDLLTKAQNLQIILDADPSNERARKELEFTRLVLSKINSGEEPFRYSMYFLIKGKDPAEIKANADLIKRGLAGIGIDVKEIDTLNNFFRKSARGTVGLPTLIPYISPYSIPSKTKEEYVSEGVFMGYEIESGTPVFWNFKNIINPHVLIVGPTGIGKTEFLLSIASKLGVIYNKTIVIYDTKGDIKKRLKENNIPFKLINPMIFSLGILKSPFATQELRALYIERILANSFLLDRLQASLIYKIIKENHYISSWKQLNDVIVDYVGENELSVYFYRIFDILDSLDYNGKSIYENLTLGINVIDLTLIHSDEIKRLIINTTLSQVHLIYPKIVDNEISKVIVIDEAWTVLKNEKMPLISDIVKRGRGYGISLLMATQNLSDLGENADIYLDNVGLLIFLNNGDMKFWEEAKRFAKLNSEDLEKLRYLGRGEALVRIINDPRPLQVKIDPLF